MVLHVHDVGGNRDLEGGPGRGWTGYLDEDAEQVLEARTSKRARGNTSSFPHAGARTENSLKKKSQGFALYMQRYGAIAHAGTSRP